MKFKFSFRKQEHNESIFQIIILIVSTFAFAFIIAQNIPIVSAEGEITWNCCSKTKAGAICQDTSSSTCSEECAETCIPSKCDKVAECKSGCCIDDKEGLCTTKSTQKKCVDEGGIWKNNENCLVPECQKGCCVLGGDVEFATEKRCGLLANIHGFEKDFRDLGTEIECLALKETQEWGACINGGSCVFNSEIDCANIGGKFSKNKLCSNPGLNAGCEKQKSVGCIEGKDEIYWFDSCGNRENIYSSDKDKSWNNGEVLKKQDACNSDDANINSETCGNCNNFLGSKCSASELGGKKAKDGNFICKSLNCVDEQGDKRNNGESWCVYDGFIGDGKDVVGSRHWRNYCIDGEVKTEPCADYRGEICAEEKMENDKGDKFSIA
ncbi:MAG: hypothetical protein KKA64_02345, partial [Nanoarchaeota archaeon]|nr:hypothetical protein [Nanoarchaeota archaeon]